MMTQTNEVLQLQLVDLLLDANVRKTVTLDKPFLQSIKTHGVIIPIVVFPPVDGKYEVFDGQRRVLGSQEAGIADIPAILAPTSEEASRIIRQVVANDQRAPITDADHTAAFKQLSLIGVSPDQISRKTHFPRQRIETALAIANSPVAEAAQVEYQMSIDEAAAFVEFETAPDAIAHLTETITKKPAQFAHEVEKLRVHRDEQASIAALTAEVAAKGIAILEDQPSHSGAWKQLNYLYVDEKRRRHPRPEDIDVQYLGAYIFTRWGNVNSREAHANYYVKNVSGAGLFTDSPTSTRNESGGLTDEEKAKRKVTRDNNKLFVPATTVRRAWIVELIARPELPKGWELIVARFIAHHSGVLDYRDRDLTSQFVGAAEKQRDADWLAKNQGKATQYMLAAALSRIEGEREYEKRGWERSESVEHLKQLSAWGYTLSDIEQAVVAGTAKDGLN